MINARNGGLLCLIILLVYGKSHNTAMQFNEII